MRQRGIRCFAIVVGAALSIASIAAQAAGHAAGEAQWSYTGPNGPAKWGTLDKEFAECKLGELQSPIDIPDATVRKGDLPSLLFNYKPAPLRIIDNGHTIQVNYAPGSFVTVNGTRYELVQFHFHKPSEEKINGKGHDMVAHLVHQGPGGKLGVVAVLLDAGKPNGLIKTLWDNLPKEKGKENAVDKVHDQRIGADPEEQGLLHVRRIADDAAVHAGRDVVRAARRLCRSPRTRSHDLEGCTR